MNEKLNTQHIIDSFAEKQHISKRSAEVFVKEFFGLVQEALKQERYVKIKGLGTFRVIEVEDRTSINVNTGERINIGGHDKITFVPDGSVKDLINKPFENFEIVVLNEESILENTPIEEEETETETETETEEEVQKEHMPQEIHEAVEDTPISVEETPAIEEIQSQEHSITEKRKFPYIAVAVILLIALIALLIFIL
ncbi:MAG: HU family DNA-binding protein [Bacteroidaceae bacterium]|nr:HU family DNA-binding protein [Bacteroidaceae bacterium]